MANIAVVYWSGTGNTEQMAQMVANGAKEAGAEVTVFSTSEFSADMVEKFDAFAFGCPSMGAEELEDTEFAPLFNECLPKLKDKKLGLFGSYGWGDGEWMRTWAENCKNAGVSLVSEGVICNDAPDDTAEAQCNALGASLA